MPLKTQLIGVKVPGFHVGKLILTLIKGIHDVAFSYDGCICP